MQTNASGPGRLVKVDKKREFLIFDLLPKEIRDCLNNAAFDYSAYQAAQIFSDIRKQYGEKYAIEHTIKCIEKQDRINFFKLKEQEK